MKHGGETLAALDHLVGAARAAAADSFRLREASSAAAIAILRYRLVQEDLVLGTQSPSEPSAP